MLGLDLDLEADLGIDSIKRVEILGMLAEVNGGQTLNVAMEKLTNIKTLGGIIDCLAAREARRGKGRSRDRLGGETAFSACSSPPWMLPLSRMLLPCCPAAPSS